MENWFSNLEFTRTLSPLPDHMLNDVAVVALFTVFIATAAAVVVVACLYFKKKPKGLCSTNLMSLIYLFIYY